MVPPRSDRVSRAPPYSRMYRSLRLRGYHPLWPAFPNRSAYLPITTGLFHVRSPLLAESLLMSVPPGTEMFQFPGFASPTYGFSERSLKEGGCPIRTPRDQSLLAAPPRFSQRATSFIASWRQGIHQMPFSYSKPNSPRTGSIQSAISGQPAAVRKDRKQQTTSPGLEHPVHTLHTHKHATHPIHQQPSRKTS